MNPVVFDTVVVSELWKPRPNDKVLAFIDVQAQPFLSVITLEELTFGAESVLEVARRAALITWIASVRARFSGRLIEIDAEIAEHSGRLRAAAKAQKREVDPSDALIAACALARGAHVATRNIKDFAPLGVPLIDPWSA